MISSTSDSLGRTHTHTHSLSCASSPKGDKVQETHSWSEERGGEQVDSFMNVNMQSKKNN